MQHLRSTPGSGDGDMHGTPCSPRDMGQPGTISDVLRQILEHHCDWLELQRFTQTEAGTLALDAAIAACEQMATSLLPDLPDEVPQSWAIGHLELALRACRRFSDDRLLADTLAGLASNDSARAAPIDPDALARTQRVREAIERRLTAVSAG